jgi:hypothetical protein
LVHASSDSGVAVGELLKVEQIAQRLLIIRGRVRLKRVRKASVAWNWSADGTEVRRERRAELD